MLKMNIARIEPSSRFTKGLRDLPDEIKEKAAKATKLFRNNPFHPSLRLHKLSGNLRNYWSISLDLKYRIIFRIEEDTAIFFSIGTHAIYEKR